MALKKWQSIILELITLIVCSIGTYMLINTALGNPMKIKGLGANIGSVTFTIAVSFALAGIIVAIRLIWRKTQKLDFFLNATWLLSLLVIWIDFFPYYGEGRAFTSLGYLIIQVAGMAFWFHFRKQKFVAVTVPEQVSNDVENPHIEKSNATLESCPSSNRTNSYNLAAKIFLAYFILEEIANIVRAASELKVSSYLGTSIGFLIAEIIVDAILIIAAAFSFKPRKYALISIITLLAIKTFAIFPNGAIQGTGYAIGANLAYLIRDFAPFAIALCFKKDGVSGWRLFFPKKGSQPTRKVAEKMQSHNSNKVAPAEEISAIKPTPTRPKQENQNVGIAKKNKQRFQFDWCLWRKSLIIAGIAAVAAVITIVIIKSNDEIEYFYLKDHTVHINRHCEQDTYYVSADMVFRHSDYVYVFCSKCISNRQMRKIEEKQLCYFYISEEFKYTPNIESVYDMIRRDYTGMSKNIADFAEGLLKKTNREIILSFNQSEKYGDWGNNITEFEHFLYNGYSLFKIGEQVYYIPDAELKRYKRLHPEAIEYSIESNSKDIRQSIYDTFVGRGDNVGSYSDFNSSFAIEENIKRYYDNAKKEGFYFPSYDCFRKLLINDFKNYRNIWNTLIRDGYKMSELDEFVEAMQNDKNVEKVYNALSKEGHRLPPLQTFKETLEF